MIAQSQAINIKSFTKSDGLKITTSQEHLNNIHNEFMQVVEGIYSELSFSVGLMYIGFFHLGVHLQNMW